MAQRDRIAIFPSRANGVLMKTRMLSAKKGHSMLKRKRDALELKLREIMALRKQTAENCNDLYAEAIFLIAKANFLDTDLKPASIIGSQRADSYMRMSSMKMIGLTLATFEPIVRKPDSLALTGLSRGGQQVEQICETFQELFKLLVLISSYDYSIKLLKDALRTTNMRLNGLEFVIMPRLANTIAYIMNELDEMEREEFYRLKRSQKNQIRKRAAKAAKEKKEGDGEETEGVDASTSIDYAMFAAPKLANSRMAQTIITGHLPADDEVISPTDSLISGVEPTVGKRTNYELWQRPAKPSRSKRKDKSADPTSSAAQSESEQDPQGSAPNNQ